MKNVFLSLMLVTSLAVASGFEKSTLQSGRYMGIGGAATSSVSGPESLYFNPAGLVTGEKNQAVFNLTAIKIEFKAPNSRADQQESSDRWSAPFALVYRHVINDQWAVAAGTYSAGGNISEYNNVSFAKFGGGDFSMTPDIFTKLAIQEFGAGFGYKVNDRLRVGAAWRAGMAMVDQSLVATTVNNTAIINTQYRNLVGWNTLGYRIGAQYDVNDKWGVGFAYRNAMHVAPTGKLFVRALSAAGTYSESPESDMSVKTQLPQQISLSSHYHCSENWISYLQYDWTNYGAVDRLIYEGAYSTSVTGAGRLGDQYVGWSDKHMFKIASEYRGYSMPIRSAFVYASRVSSNNFATSTLAPPGPSYTLSLGTGKTIMDNMKIDGAIDYTMISASVGPSDPLNGTATVNATTKAGNYNANVLAIHLGTTYDF